MKGQSYLKKILIRLRSIRPTIFSLPVGEKMKALILGVLLFFQDPPIKFQWGTFGSAIGH